MRKIAAAVLATFFLIHAGASAQSTASLTISDFTYTLVDHDLNDGVDAMLTFLPSSEWYKSSGYLWVSGPQGSVTNLQIGSGVFAPVAASAASSQGSASNSLSGTVDSNLLIQLDGTLIGSGYGEHFVGNKIYTRALGFELSPKTSVIFSASVSMNIEVTPDNPYAWFRTELFARMASAANIFGDAKYSRDYTGVLTYDGSDSRKSSLTVALENPLDTWTTNEVEMESHMSISRWMPPPIPEPETWAMLIGGLAVVFMRVRRPYLSRTDAK